MIRRRLKLFGRIFALFLVVNPAFCLTSLQARQNGPSRLDARAELHPSLNQQTLQDTPAPQGPVSTKDVEGDVVALCIHTLKTIELVITVAAGVVGLLSLVSVGAILLYRSRIERIDELRRHLEGKVSKLEEKIGHLETHKIELEREERQVEESLNRTAQERDHLVSEYKVLASSVNALMRAVQVQNGASPRRLQHLQELGEMKNPVGIAPMLAILLNANESEVMRSHAAHGLGRYSEEDDTKEYWTQIVEAFLTVLKDNAASELVLVSAIQAIGKYGQKASLFIGTLLDWAADPRACVRKGCAEAFGSCGLFDHMAVQRLRELLKDPAAEVRDAAEKALQKLQ